MTKKRLWAEIKDQWPDTFRDNFVLLCFTMVGGLAPLWMTFGLKAWNTGVWPSIFEFSRAGEFTLYAASMVSPALFFLAHDRKKSPFPQRDILILAAVVQLMLAIYGYFLVGQRDTQVVPNREELLKYYSLATIALFLVGTLFAYGVAILDATRVTQDPKDIDDADVETMARRMNDLPK